MIGQEYEYPKPMTPDEFFSFVKKLAELGNVTNVHALCCDCDECLGFTAMPITAFGLPSDAALARTHAALETLLADDAARSETRWMLTDIGDSYLDGAR